MKVTKWADMGAEVEVEIGADHNVQTEIKHEGLYVHRLDPAQNNPREIAFAERWQKDNSRWATLQNLLVHDGGDSSYWKEFQNLLGHEAGAPLSGGRKVISGLPYDQNSASVAATTIQWLGSNVGFVFLREAIEACGYKIVPMTDKAILIRAESIARLAHAGQKEIGGGDYILHVERVVALCVGEQAKAVAWLHDVLEDTPLTASDLLELGISERIVRAVVCLTRNAERYPEYIHRVKASGDDLALEVKKADLRDHLRPSCPESLLARYERAWHVLAPGVETPRG